MAKKPSSLPLFKFDRDLCADGEIAGADEAGRGSLAGPLVAAAVVLDYRLHDPQKYSRLLRGLNDSKKLTPEERERLFSLIVTLASRFTVVSYSNRTIDSDGLHVVNLRALAAALEALDPCPAVALVDGRQKLPDLSLEHEPVTRGDSRSACIAAASILAKVTRDRLMRRLHADFPVYGFESHVGYSTHDHRAAIKQHGFSRLHRLSFKTNFDDGEQPEKND
jgi:ribonuclease HII